MKEPMTKAPDTASAYLLLFRGLEWDQGLGPEDLQRVMDEVMAWFEGLQEQGKVKGGQPLDRSGRYVSGKGGRIIADGPFAESKEVVGGYLLLDTDSLEEAVAVARSCPTLNYGITIEVRPVLEDCPVFRRVRERLALATA